MEAYKSIIKEIINLKWESLDEKDLQKLMILSAFSALEFADSLRLTIKLNPENRHLKKMANEELNTNNLSFGEYSKNCVDSAAESLEMAGFRRVKIAKSKSVWPV